MADLSNASFRNADLTNADLRETKREGVDFSNANLRGANLPNFKICPETGSFIGYKKVWSRHDFLEVILTLRIIGERTNSLSWSGRKCRTSKARVLDAHFHRVATGERCPPNRVFRSFHDPDFTYTVGQLLTVPNYNPDIRVECAPGIHFFMTSAEAEAYVY